LEGKEKRQTKKGGRRFEKTTTTKCFGAVPLQEAVKHLHTKKKTNGEVGTQKWGIKKNEMLRLKGVWGGSWMASPWWSHISQKI